jgi:hypothetical protein
MSFTAFRSDRVARRIACRRLSTLVVRNLLRQRARNLLPGSLTLVSSFVIVCLAMLLDGVQPGGTSVLEIGYAIVTTLLMLAVGASLAFTAMRNVVERRQEIATLAALGATARRIRRVLVGECLLLALLPAGLGVAIAIALYVATAGTGIAVTSQELVEFLGASYLQPAWNGAGVIAGLVLPLAVALPASSFFAWRAARCPIADALADRPFLHGALDADRTESRDRHLTA